MNFFKKLQTILLVSLCLFLFISPVFAVSPTPSTFTGYEGEYFNNRNLQGTPVLVRDDPSIQFDWGVGSPDPMVHSDRFSIRWTKTVNLSAGMYLFNIVGDDGVRVFVDNNLLVDQWHDQPSTSYKAYSYLGAGSHSIKIEYFEEYGGAVVKFSYGLVPTPDSSWSGSYFNNQTLTGIPALTRSDQLINFTWDNGSPDPKINNDHFSARWTKQEIMRAGKYSFTVKSDDGIRFWINNQLIIDDWTNHAMKTYVPDINLEDGLYTFKVEYFENTGAAVAIVTEDYPARNQALPTLTPTPSPSPLVIGAALGNYSEPTGQACTITVPSQFNTIQAAINAAVNGNTVCVETGIYNENVQVNKSITLAGHGINSPSIITPVSPMYNEGATLKIEADNVTVEGFTVMGLGPDYQNAALRIGESRSGDVIKYNHIMAGNGGLALLTDGFQNTQLIQNNILEGNSSPQVALVNGTPNVGKASNKVDFLNDTFIGTAKPTERDSSGTVLTQQANNSSISKNVFDTTGATYAMIDTTVTVLSFNNINTASIIKVRGSGVNAENNWWGDTDPSNNVLGVVDFTPFASSPFAEN